jgi:hypothetical protein
MLAGLGTRTILYALVATSLAGAVVTWLYRIETTGIDLDTVGLDPAAASPLETGRRP